MNWNSSNNSMLIDAILSLNSKEEIQNFFDDLLTEKEIEKIVKRLKTAHLLSENVAYSEIERITGLSSTTVARVAKWLNGKSGGYQTVLARVKQHTSPQ